MDLWKKLNVSDIDLVYFLRVPYLTRLRMPPYEVGGEAMYYAGVLLNDRFDITGRRINYGASASLVPAGPYGEVV